MTATLLGDDRLEGSLLLQQPGGVFPLHVIDADGGRYGTDEAHQLLVGVNADPAMPLGQPTRGPQSPGGEGKKTTGKHPHTSVFCLRDKSSFHCM